MSVTTAGVGTALAAGWPGAGTTAPGMSSADLAVGPALLPAMTVGSRGPAPAGGAGRLGPSDGELARLRRVAVGEEDADLLVHSGTVVVVQTGELLQRDVAIVGRFIAAVTRPGALAGRRSLDATGRYLLPAYVDAHVRPERTLLLPGEAARLLVPRGTVTVLTDPAGLVARCGPRGAGIATTTDTPLRVLARRPGAPGPAAGDLLPGEQTVGHRTLADLIGYGQLACAVRSGITAGLAPAEAVRRATLVPARRHGLDQVLGAILPAHLADLLIVTEIGGVEPPDLVVAGGRIAAGQGRPLFENPDRAPRWALDTVRLPVNLHVDSFALSGWPGHPAPLPVAVEIVSRISTPVVPSSRTPGLAGLVPGRPVLPGVGGLAPTGPLQPPATASTGAAAPRQVRVEPAVRNGLIVADPDHDLLKVAVVDRSGSHEPVRVGLLRGVGLTSGAVGVTTSDPPGDLVLVGTNDADMLTAARALEGMGGGYVVIDRGWVQAACPLPVAGIVSDAPWEAVDGQLAAADAAAAAIGCRLAGPLQTLADLGAALFTRPAP
ncbi:adenine deaminase [Frankia sp. AgB1.9]|uniref:adenine deaminase C-terminal domain-containing protein n=2 Tax=unclassified Frankia TaxID=2632575 RepID=UPI00193164F9|nr:adenine deaminase C-terminal domain-containing protein [Frankia sp. AgB1.9]MBL7492464.1 adenine deaminase [Frankia sp. AgW1.1]MBL7547064.1 adenine deaminase [Frankia sp. AgB1.9]